MYLYWEYLIEYLSRRIEEGAPSSPEVWCDSSSEVSDEGYKSTGTHPTIRIRKASQIKPEANDYNGKCIYDL